jgi:hypothetical protein
VRTTTLRNGSPSLRKASRFSVTAEVPAFSRSNPHTTAWPVPTAVLSVCDYLPRRQSPSSTGRPSYPLVTWIDWLTPRTPALQLQCNYQPLGLPVDPAWLLLLSSPALEPTPRPSRHPECVSIAPTLRPIQHTSKSLPAETTSAAQRELVNLETTVHTRPLPGPADTPAMCSYRRTHRAGSQVWQSPSHRLARQLDTSVQLQDHKARNDFT